MLTNLDPNTKYVVRVEGIIMETSIFRSISNNERILIEHQVILFVILTFKVALKKTIIQQSAIKDVQPKLAL